MNDFQPKQTYKNRAEAFRLYIRAQGLPVSQAKFYQDADRLRMTAPDKSIELSALLAYIRSELKVDPVTGQSLVDQNLSSRMDELDLKEKELKIAKLEREARKDDDQWIHRETVYEREGAIVGSIMAELKYRLSRGVPELIALSKGDEGRAPEVKDHLNRMLYQAFQSLYDSAEIDMAFESDEPT